MALGDPIRPEDLVRSVVRTTMLFGEYRGKLAQLNDRAFTKDFFVKFVRAWGLRRTIGEGERKFEKVWELIACHDLERLAQGTAKTVDEIAEYYKRKGLSAKSGGKSKSFRTTRSLVSKIGFIAEPDKYVPCDTYSMKGLNLRRGRIRDGGEGYLMGGYENYLELFNRCYSLLEDSIDEECSQEWAIDLAKVLNVEDRWVGDDAFYRKVLDDVLMTEGGRYPGT